MDTVSIGIVCARFTNGGRRRTVSEFLCGALLAWLMPEEEGIGHE
jgi:hypothetical protein